MFHKGFVCFLNRRLQNINLSNDICKVQLRCASSKAAEQEVVDTVDLESTQAREAEIDIKRNKSGLKEFDRNILFNKVPYPEPAADFHNSVKYKRKIFGRYGMVSGVNPGILWPTKQDLKEVYEYESIAHPFTIQEMVDNAVQKQKDEEAAIQLRMTTIEQNFGKLNQWKNEIKARAEKKLAEAETARKKKEKLIEEVRRHFGYKIDPNDERFKEMLEKKQKEDKKILKEEKKKMRQEKMMSLMLEGKKIS